MTVKKETVRPKRRIYDVIKKSIFFFVKKCKIVQTLSLIRILVTLVFNLLYTILIYKVIMESGRLGVSVTEKNIIQEVLERLSIP